MWSPPCLLLLLQTLVSSLAISFQRQSEHQQIQEDRVFLDDSTAHKFLGRKLLYNYWDLELIVPDNLERECREEICTYEEAREVFEDDKKTAEDITFYRGKNFRRVRFSCYSVPIALAEEATPAEILPSPLLLRTQPCNLPKSFWETYEHNGKGGAKTVGVDVAGLVAGLIAAMVSIVMFVIVAMYCFKYRAKRRNQSRTLDNLYPLATFGEEPKPELAPGLPSYEQAMASSGVHDAPPPPYQRASTNSALPT